MPDDEWELVHAHTRADMLKGGWLVDVTGLAREAGFRRASVAFTAAAWLESTGWGLSPDGPETGRRALQALRAAAGAALELAMSGEADTDRAGFRVPGSSPPVGLVLHTGPGDHGEMVFTVLLDGED